MSKLASLTGAAVFFGLTGCVATTPDWDARFGEAARTLAAQQVIAPEASQNPSSVSGIDGKAGQGAMERYGKSFAAEQKSTPTLNLNISEN